MRETVVTRRQGAAEVVMVPKVPGVFGIDRADMMRSEA